MTASDSSLATVQGPIAIVGSGSIGMAWAIVHARAGRPVQLHDTSSARLDAALRDIEHRLMGLEAAGLLEEEPRSVRARISVGTSLSDAVRSATHVQECVPERIDLKRSLFARLDAEAPTEATLASSSSAITCSAFAATLKGRDRCMVVHPANPPYLLPIVEVVPAPFTSELAISRVMSQLDSAGMAPVRVSSEPEGFVLNRLQGALLREAYCLVRDGIVSANDVDRVVQDGLGRRWSVIGPFATAELNTRGGIEEHAARLGPAYARMGAERGQHDPWTPELVSRVAAEVQRRLPPGRWEANVAWRDEALMALERARRESDLFDEHGPGADDDPRVSAR